MVRARYIDICGTDLPEKECDGCWDGYRAGSESCHLLVPGIDGMKALSSRVNPEKLGLVTPIAGPGQDSSILRAVEAAEILGWDEIVVNDWGILDQVGRLNGPRITAGRLLMRLRRGPGEFDSWDELDTASKRYFAWGPLYDSSFLEFLGQMGVTRLELDPPRHWMPVPEVDGFALSLHLEERFITVSASCPWLYDDLSGTWEPLDGCGRRCLAGDLSMSSARLDRPLILRGRSILERVVEPVDEECLPESVDRLIYSDQLTTKP